MDAVAAFVAAVNATIINPILALLFALAVFMFMWGALSLVIGAGNDTQRQEGKAHMLWGILGMVIMVSVYALLNIGLNTFNVDTDANLPDELPLPGA